MSTELLDDPLRLHSLSYRIASLVRIAAVVALRLLGPAILAACAGPWPCLSFDLKPERNRRPDHRIHLSARRFF
jgi:hypothetical protein